jgi:hypothetical protein
MFRRNVAPPSLMLFLVHRFLSPWWWRRYVPLKHGFLQEPHSVTSQKTAFFILVLCFESKILQAMFCVQQRTYLWICCIGTYIERNLSDTLTLQQYCSLILCSIILLFRIIWYRFFCYARWALLIIITPSLFMQTCLLLYHIHYLCDIYSKGTYFKIASHRQLHWCIIRNVAVLDLRLSQRWLKNVVFWDVTLCDSCKNWHFWRNVAPPSSEWQESVN